MLTVPSAIFDQLYLHAGATMGLSAYHGRLMVEPTLQSRYSLCELL